MCRKNLVATLVVVTLAMACASAPVSPDRLASLGTVAVVARLEGDGPTSHVNEDDAFRSLIAAGLAPEEADRRLTELLRKIEDRFQLETRFRGELVDHLGQPPPFEIANPAVVSAATGSLLARPEGKSDYRRLSDAGISAVLELTVVKLELLPASSGRPPGLSAVARARLLSLPAQKELWASSVEVLPEAGSAVVVEPAALKADVEGSYREALGATARTVGEALARDLRGPPPPGP